jgi:CBS domain-containing protein
MISEPVVGYPDVTLREMANVMAEYGVTRVPVLDRADPRRLIGVVTLPDLLHARRIDLEEERVSERIFHVRQFVPLPGGGVRRESEQTVVTD